MSPVSSRSYDLNFAASSATPFGGIGQHKQIQTGHQEQGERQHRQEAQPVGIPLLCHSVDVDDDGQGKGNGQPAVDLPNPFVPVQGTSSMFLALGDRGGDGPATVKKT